MRTRTLIGRVLVTASMLVAATVGTAAPASAGTPYSDWCSDGVGFLETPLITSPITLGVEVNRNPLDTTQQIQLCYSDTAVGSPGNLTGGVVIIRYDYTLGGTHNTLRLTVACHADTGVTLPVQCFEQTVIQTFPTGLPTAGTSPTTICLVTAGGGCVLYLPGVWVQLEPVLRISTTTTVPFDLPPAQCVALLVPCP